MQLQFADVRFDWRLYGIATGGALLLGTLIGLLPALHSTRFDINAALKDGSRSVGGRRRHRLRNFLIASQVAMALILCVISGLLIKACLQMQGGDLGFAPERVTMVEVNLRQDVYPNNNDRCDYNDRAVEALREMPGVESAGLMMGGTLASYGMNSDVQFLGLKEKETWHKVKFMKGTHGAASILGMQLVKGRDLSEDSVIAEGEVLINETLVKEFFADRDPIGTQLKTSYDGTSPPATIVGVVRDRHPLTTYEGNQPEIVMGFRRMHFHGVSTFMVTTRSPGLAMAPAIREVIQGLDQNQPVAKPRLVAVELEARKSGPRKAMLALGSIAGIGLLIAMMGVYGVVAYTVNERTREVGIRMAVGASKSQVQNLIAWSGARLLAMGALPGLFIGATVVRLLPDRADFFGFGDFSPATYLSVLLLVGITGALAARIPARRAANLEPMNALRHE